jgi:hypothetical protein
MARLSSAVSSAASPCAKEQQRQEGRGGMATGDVARRSTHYGARFTTWRTAIS